ncbi:hypothetical protein COD86_16585 [Bacillus cereus]|nr:hypothetical protein COD14_30515 [Bacillus cereus]PGV94029.1 hypothetical protein COD86_16585 [Bacillus cereus]
MPQKMRRWCTMTPREKRIRILNLQDQYCSQCEKRKKPLKDCILHCEVGKEMRRLGAGLFTSDLVRKSGKRIYRNWDELIPKIIEMRGEGHSLYRISQIINCSLAVLNNQMKKRGLL